MHEIVTLQFGNRANYVATHFWNIQESYFTYGGQAESPVDHDVHFRPGIGVDGTDTYMPRTLIYDLKSNFGPLRKVNALYDPGEDVSTTTQSPAAVHRDIPIEQHTYQRHLEEGLDPLPIAPHTVRYWADYNRVFYHPRSIHPLSQQDLPSLASLSSFADWTTGQGMFEHIDQEHDLLGGDIRWFVEECDHFQGFQCFFDASDAWGGWTSSWLEQLRDEYGRTSVVVWGLEEARSEARGQQAAKSLSNTRSVVNITSSASMYSPLSSTLRSLPSYVQSDHSLWHTSAIQATAIEATTLPTRLRPVEGRRTLLSDLESTINHGGTRIISELEFSASNPENVRTDRTVNGHSTADHRMINGHDGLDEDLTDIKRCDVRLLDLESASAARETASLRFKQDHFFGRFESLRGEWELSAEVEESNAAVRARSRNFGQPTVLKHQSELLFPLLSSFPPVFHLNPGNCRGLAIRAALSTSTNVPQRLKVSEEQIRRSTNLNIDERNELWEKLRSMSEEYLEGWESDEESGEDDI